MGWVCVGGGHLRTLVSCSAWLHLCMNNYFDNILRTLLVEKMIHFVVYQFRK